MAKANLSVLARWVRRALNFSESNARDSQHPIRDAKVATKLRITYVKDEYLELQTQYKSRKPLYSISW